MIVNDAEDTICAISTAAGMGAIALIRMTGSEALAIGSRIFSKDLSTVDSHKAVFGTIKKDDQLVDEVVVTAFRNPHSFTGEDVVEIACHGSIFIQQSILKLLLEAGCRLAKPGEFTMRAFMNGKMDLSQAEAVGDLIASESAAAHELAMNQMRGGVSNELKALRQQLLDFTSLIELELDFSEEDVEFADRTQLTQLIATMQRNIGGLLQSFQYGNAIKQGVPTVILGKPNAGKSTLLNALLQENRAIVSATPGTTRDVIEDRLVIDGIEFRLQDTAGLRQTTDDIEAQGVQRSEGLARKASLLLYVFDPAEETADEARAYVQNMELPQGTRIVYIANKSDLHAAASAAKDNSLLHISAKEGHHLDDLRARMVDEVNALWQSGSNSAVVLTNARHVQELEHALSALQEVERGLAAGIPGDLLTIDIRLALHHLGEITGEITNDEVLGNIFGRFCIGK